MAKKNFFACFCSKGKTGILTNFQRCNSVADDEESYVLFVNCRGPGIPSTYVKKLEISDINNNFKSNDFLLYNNNAALKTTVGSKVDNWITRDFLTYQSQNFTAKPYNYELFYNRGLDKSADKKYALLGNYIIASLIAVFFRCVGFASIF